jgi:predicted aldo/keto reductase-like oxidoreductase
MLGQADTLLTYWVRNLDRTQHGQKNIQGELMTRREIETTRRQFLKATAGVSSGAILGTLTPRTLAADGKVGQGMPTRELGKTGMKISTLAFGGGSQFKRNKNGDWEPLLQKAVELGINYFDTHNDYGTESRFGEILPQYRDKIYIATKFDPRDEKGAMRSFERSLKALKTDYVDALMIHALSSKDDIEAIEKGVWKRMQQLKSEGIAKFIGFSSMDSAGKSKEFIEKLAPDVAMVAMNPTRYRKYAEMVVEPALKHGTGLLAMKVVRGIVGQNNNTPSGLLYYALSQDGVAAAVVGHYGMNILEENVGIVRKLDGTKKMSMRRQGIMERRCASLANPATLCWARPDYIDNGDFAMYA